MKYIDLFAGIGGFRLGLDRAGHECVFTNEWLDKPASIYEKNFGGTVNRQDIRTITANDIPDADLIVGGFPCATFSFAGKRTGLSLDDTRGTLCFEMFRLARDKRIPYILFENVKGLLNHDKGRTFCTILSALDEMGYDTQWELLDSKNFGVPQHRERIFLFANRRGEPRPEVFPLSPASREDEECQEEGGFVIGQWRRSYLRTYKSTGTPTLTANMGTGGNNVPLVIYDDGRMRKLTPVECERLQGFPDDFTKYYADGSLVSNSERYERCGRTVSVPVIEAIGKKLYV